MKKRILALLLTLALVLPAVSCDVLLADPNAPATPSDSQSESNNNTPDTERVPSKGPEVHTQPETPPVDPEPETEYIPKEFKVTFVLESYDHEYGIQFVKEGNTVGKPQVSIDPAIGSFDGIWYTDPHFKQAFDFGTYIAEDITLYGRFVPNPAAPVGLIGAEQLAELASADWEYGSSDIGSADVLTQGTHSFVRLTGGGIGDPWLMVARDCGKMPDYLVIRYRTNSEIDGEMYIGSGNGPHGGGDHLRIDWNESEEWNLAIIHLPTCGVTAIKKGVIDYFRFDFFAGHQEGDYIDIAYIGFFNSAEYAEAYDLEHYPPYVEKEAAGMKNHSIDTFFANGEMYFEQDGMAGDKLTAQENKVVFKTGETAQSIALRGWIGFDQAIASFGYYVDGYDFVWGEFAQATEDGVLAAGGEFASRFHIIVPLTGLTSGTEHKIGFILKLADGTVVRLREELTVVIENTKWDENRDIVVLQSFDELFYEPGRVGIFTPGQSSRWDKVATITDFSVDTLYYWGWIAYMGELGQFGYQINYGEAIYDDAWAWETGEDVVNAAKGTGADGGRRMQIAISLAGLLGKNNVRVLYKTADGTVILLNEFTVNLPARAPFEVPEHTEETIDLGKRGNGGPFSGMDKKKFGQRFNIGENFLKAINIKDMAAYANPVNTWAFRIWAWDTDYATTTAAEPIYVLTGENHPDNTTFTVTDLAAYGITGDFYYEIEHVSGDAGFTGWKAEEYVAEGVQTYVAGELVEGTYSSFIVVGVAVTDTPDEPDAPVVEYYDNLAIPQDQWVISGHRPQLQNSSDGMVAAAGVEYAALLHQGSIYLGEIDLSKYSKVVIYWGSDNSQITMDRYNENAHNRIMLLSADMNMMNSPTEDTIIAGSTYTLHGWKVEAHEIDLTDVDYNGPVYVTWDTLPGTFMVIASVEFVA